MNQRPSSANPLNPLRAPEIAAALILTAAVAAAFQLPNLGFYDDDWAWMSIFSGAADRSYAGIVAQFAKSQVNVWLRPLNFLVFPWLYTMFGVSPLPYHCLLAALNAWGACALWRWLEEEGIGRPTAALAAGLFVLWPNHDATRHWVCLASSPCALALTLEALRLRRKRPLLAGVLLAMGGLLYEAAAPLALAPFLLTAWRSRRLGPEAAVRAGARESAPLLAGLAFIFVWQRVPCRLWLEAERHPISLSPLHALRVLWSGLECQILNRLCHVVARNAQWAADHIQLSGWVSWGMAAIVAITLTRRLVRRESARADAPPLALAVFLLGYAPYVLDQSYSPAIFSPTNRVNLVPSIGAALFAAWALQEVRTSRRPAARAAGRAFAMLLPAAFLLAAWSSNSQWAEATRRQQQIIKSLDRYLTPLPAGPKTLLVYGLETFVGSAPVFNSTYDLNGALAIERNDPELRAMIGEGRVRFEDDKAVMSWFGDVPIPYEGLYAYRHQPRRFKRLDGRAAGEHFVSQ